MQKTLLVVLDGLGDRSVPELNNQTPLEAASTPNFDYLAKEGIGGLLKPTFNGNYPTSVEGHWNLFGYPLSEVMGRGIFEALGVDFDLRKGDVALRGNWATWEQGKIVDRRAGRIKKTQALVEKLNGMTVQGVKVLIKSGVEHRFTLVLRGRKLSDEIVGNDPHQVNISPSKVEPKDEKDKRAVFTASVLNEFMDKAHQILKNCPFNQKRKQENKLPANYLLLRKAGQWGKKRFEDFSQKWGFDRCGFITGGGLYRGIALAVGMEEITVAGATGGKDTNLNHKFTQAVKSLQHDSLDFIFLHVKATDLFSHNGDCRGKKNYIEKIDRFAFDLKRLNDTMVIVTGDHATPCKKQQHSGDAIPFLVWSDQIQGNEVEKFGEEDCVSGEIIDQNQLINFVLSNHKK